MIFPMATPLEVRQPPHAATRKRSYTVGNKQYQR
jgi:hypothetical protein